MMTKWFLLAVTLIAAARPMDRKAEKAVIALAPVGDVDPAAVAALVPVLETAFGSRVVVGPPVPLVPSAYEPRRRQYLSTALLDALAAVKRPDWERLLGVADVDLYVPELNFVFGEADSRRAVGVFSLYRLHPGGTGAEAQALFRKRAATEALHELGHTYGLGHCRDPHCVMWFSNTLAESDRKGTRFCAAHAAAVEARRP
jgi:archaemetzincin